MPILFYFIFENTKFLMILIIDLYVSRSGFSTQEAIMSSETNLSGLFDLDLQTSSEPINVYFAKRKLHQTSQVMIDMEVKDEDFTFAKDFIVCNMNGIDLLLENVFFET